MFRTIPMTLAAGAIALSSLTAVSNAATVTFAGELDLVLEDSGSSDLSGINVGTSFAGSIDDETFTGSVTGGPGTIEFGCCMAAGGLELTDNAELDADEAEVLNALQVATVFAAGDMLDIINLEGDTDSDAGRIEVGVSLIYAPDTYDDESPSNFPVTDSAPLFSVFFLLQEDTAENEDIFSALGLIDDLDLGRDTVPDVPTPSPVPLPAGAPLMLIALLGLFGISRHRKQNPGRSEF